MTTSETFLIIAPSFDRNVYTIPNEYISTLKNFKFRKQRKMDVSGGSFESLTTIQPNIRRLDPFWATRLWQKLIREATSNVRVCRQRHFLKNYDNVFNGEDLVNVILRFLKECSSELDVNRIERTNAIKVCQVLMEKKLFESVVPKGNTKFEDSSNKFYRFIQDDKVISNETAIECAKNRSILEDKENIFHSPGPNNSSLLESEILNSSSFKRCNIRRSLRFKTPLMRVRETKPSPVRFSKRNARDSDEEVAFEELRETSLAILLHLVDIPVLESLLEVPSDLPELPEAPQPFVLENDFTPRKMRPLNLNFHSPVTDLPWIRTASVCLGGGHPPGLAGLWSVQACKILCYKVVNERFSCSAESIIPGEYFSICVSIVKMLKGDQRQRALYALQLLVFHLPIKRRQQLQNLLYFLDIVVEDLFVNVDKKITNYEAVVRDFLSIVFKHPLVSQEHQKILFDFLLLKSKTVFTTPPILWKIKEAGFRLCENMPTKSLESFTPGYTRKCLADLATHIVDSTEIKLAEKKVWLKKLKKYHTEVYDFCHFTE